MPLDPGSIPGSSTSKGPGQGKISQPGPVYINTAHQRSGSTTGSGCWPGSTVSVWPVRLGRSSGQSPLGSTWSAREIDEDGLARHGGVDVVLGSGSSGIRPAVGLTRTHRGDGALVGR